MARRYGTFVKMLVVALSCSSCTCQQEPTPVQVPPPATRPPGFSATLPSAPSPTRPPAVPSPVPPTAPTGSASPAGVTIPDDFPSDVQVFKDATVTAVHRLGGGAHNVLFSTSGESREVFSFYKDDLKQKGHEVTQEYQTPEQSFISFKKGQLVTNIVIAKDPNDPNRRVIAIMYQVEEEVEEF